MSTFPPDPCSNYFTITRTRPHRRSLFCRHASQIPALPVGQASRTSRPPTFIVFSGFFFFENNIFLPAAQLLVPQAGFWHSSVFIHHPVKREKPILLSNVSDGLSCPLVSGPGLCRCWRQDNRNTPTTVGQHETHMKAGQPGQLLTCTVDMSCTQAC